VKSLRLAVFAAVLAALLFAIPAHAQVLQGNTASVAMSFTQTESLIVSTDVSSVTFNAAGVASSPINVTTTWNATAARTQLEVYAYVPSSNAFTGAHGNTIPAADLQQTSPDSSLHTCNGQLTILNGSTLNNACGWIFDGSLPSAAGTQTGQVNLTILNFASIAPDSFSGTYLISAQIL
jgi:hypothetical protein